MYFLGRFFLFITKEIYKHAMAEITDESVITRKLLEAQIRYDLGEIGDDEYEILENELIARLHTAREWKLQLAEEESEDFDGIEDSEEDYDSEESEEDFEDSEELEDYEDG